ncbi:hypothetical protein WS90_25185 [Burkholderia cepacia]|uniref:Type III secretion protein HpaP n=1 Tax=Burkholderia cepacia TaxID=292 RepID=A0A103Z9N1_BURCE|nr:type III secretion system protein SctP [Burkholderia cepacia]KVK75942.1 hypothetical protein WS90_25185 [Burkholderia cepacia]
MTFTRRIPRAVRIHALPSPAPQSVDAARRARFAALRGAARSADAPMSMRDVAEAQPAPVGPGSGTHVHARDAVAGDERVDARQHAVPDDDAPESSGLSSRIALACLQESRARLTAERIAARVAEFCNAKAVRQNGTWSARLRLDPNLLPDALLSMTLSLACLSLRFETANAQSRQLICAHQATLRTTLEAALHGSFELDIDVG